jgi:hypothetical protein
VIAAEEIALDCPYCRQEIYRPLAWFKQAYASCPACGGGLMADQFAKLVQDLEQAMEAQIDDMVQGGRVCGCH